MKFDSNIKDTLKATLVIAAVTALIVAGIQLYTTLTNDDDETQCNFATSALEKHHGFDLEDFRATFNSLLLLVTNSSVEGDTKDIDLTLINEVMKAEGYTDTLSTLYPPTYETALILNNMVREGNLFKTSLTYLRIAWESKKSGNIEQFEEQCTQAQDFFNRGEVLYNETITELEGIVNQFCP